MIGVAWALRVTRLCLASHLCTPQGCVIVLCAIERWPHVHQSLVERHEPKATYLRNVRGVALTRAVRGFLARQRTRRPDQFPVTTGATHLSQCHTLSAHEQAHHSQLIHRPSPGVYGAASARAPRLTADCARNDPSSEAMAVCPLRPAMTGTGHGGAPWRRGRHAVMHAWLSRLLNARTRLRV